ncbi:MAG: flavodoxin [Chloroflexi bacterium B3_Chlor]|nr:MAG: flavodoxin [Chloroflexi bacterium B3_Chlor]
MSDKILVAYATKAGSTAEVAEAVGQELRDAGAEVEVQPAKEVKDLSPYKAVIVGSAIRMGKWVPEATSFVEKNREALSQVPVAYFVVCMTMKDDTEENHRTVEAYLDPVCEIVEPLDKGLFAGTINYSKLSFPARTMSKAMKVSEGDFRDWEAIGAWARQVHSRLTRG